MSNNARIQRDIRIAIEISMLDATVVTPKATCLRRIWIDGQAVRV
jgi:hypothetical protein